MKTFLISLLVITAYALKVQLVPQPKTYLSAHDQPRVQGDKIPLTDYQELQYYGDLLFGSNRQSMSVLFDTGSSICWIPTTECPVNECTGGRFDNETSVTYVNQTSEGQLTYISGQVQGFYSTDYVCVEGTLSKCTSQNFQFLAVKSTGSLSVLQADGVCGMQPPNAGAGTNQLVPMLFASGAIDANMFTMKLTESSATSFVEFGEPDSGLGTFTTAKLSEDPNLWSTDMPKTDVADYGNLNAIGIVFDSGSSYMYCTQNDLQVLLNFVK